jgi:Fe-S-cluster containining protein
MPLPAPDAELLKIIDSNFADAARRAGEHLVCRIGCTQCCHGAFAIDALDAQRLKAGMKALRAADPSTAEAVKLRARAWIAEYGAEFPGDASTGLLGTSDEDQASFEEFANDAPCPALDPTTGRCDVYPWRPMTCRLFGPPVRSVNDEGDVGLGHCELCFTTATDAQIAAAEMQVPHELEAELLAETGDDRETLVAFALLR